MDNVNVGQMLQMFSNEQLETIIKECEQLIESRQDHTLIVECDLSLRAIKTIKAISRSEGVEIKYLTQLARFGEANLLAWEYVGKKTLREIKDQMYLNNIKFPFGQDFSFYSKKLP